MPLSVFPLHHSSTPWFFRTRETIERYLSSSSGWDNSSQTTSLWHVLTLGLKCLHHTANLKAVTKSPRHTTAFILMKTDFPSRFSLFWQSASSMAKRDNDIKEPFTEKNVFQLKKFELLSLLGSSELSFIKFLTPERTSEFMPPTW